jgi:hypothetical protein
VCKSKLRFNKTVFLWGEGTFYETDKRLVVIRDPPPLMPPPPPIGPLVPPANLIFHDEDNNEKQYMQVGLDEIEKSRKVLFDKIKIDVKDNCGNEYMIYLKIN